MEYKLLYREFQKTFPELNDRLNSISKEKNVDDEDGMHIIFGIVVTELIANLIVSDDSEELLKVFSFLEKMAISENSEICEVLEFSLLEDFISRGKDYLSKCKKFMQEETLRCCLTVETYMM